MYIIPPKLHEIDICNYLSFIDGGIETQRSNLNMFTNLEHSGVWI